MCWEPAARDGHEELQAELEQELCQQSYEMRQKSARQIPEIALSLLQITQVLSFLCFNEARGRDAEGSGQVFECLGFR